MLDTESVASATVDTYDLPAVAGLAEKIHETAAELRELLQRIELHVDEQHHHAKATSDIDEMQRLTDADPYRWLADAKHALQSGIMFADRALAQRSAF